MLGIYARTSREEATKIVSTIEQQVKEGIAFANNHNLEYKIFQDKGASGYKLEDDDSNIFLNRPAFSELINEIKEGNIDTVWVWEHSRLSRNQYASAYIANLFAKFKISLYEKDKKFDLDDPSTKLMRGVLDVIAEYERQLIVGRTTRGLYNSINSGKRSYAKLFGYKKLNKNKEGNYEWEVVPSEIAQLKDWYAKFQAGNSLRSIIQSYIKNPVTQQQMIKRATKLGRFLRHYEYTSFVLTTEGLKILHQFDNFEIPTIEILKDRKYWVKSKVYTEEIITIDEWIDIRERLQNNKQIRHTNMTSHRNSDLSLGTGLITCTECGSKYFYHVQNYKVRTGDHKGENRPNYYYFHHKTIGSLCNQKPKCIALNKLDTILDIFMLYHLAIFDNTKYILNEAIKQKEIELLASNENIKNLKTQKEKFLKQIEKYQAALDTTDDVGTITIIAKQIDNTEKKIEQLNNDITDLTVLIEKQADELNNDKMLRDYHSFKDSLKNYFEVFNTQEKRNLILKESKSIKLNNNILTIECAEISFEFDVRFKYKFPTELYNDLINNDEFMKEMSDVSLFQKNIKPVLDMIATPYMDNYFYDEKNKVVIFWDKNMSDEELADFLDKKKVNLGFIDMNDNPDFDN